ncbi:MAG: hypothetical protein KAR22_16180, partial [Gammaproteobacteria bacterium]|nr:hypothetical protein [Gammaproteobacteria bacterium]
TAQPVKRVEVVNLPDPQNVTGSVEVTNLPAVQDVNVTNAPAGPPSRFQLVGFTTAALPGDSGLFAFTLACQAEFFGSRICTSREVFETVDVPTGLRGTFPGADVGGCGRDGMQGEGFTASVGTGSHAVVNGARF